MFLISVNGQSTAVSCGGSFGDPVFTENFGSTPNSYLTLAGPMDSSNASTTYNYTHTFPPNDGFYTISNSTNPGSSGFSWITSSDHTADTAGNYGNMLVVNASHSPGEFYRRQVKGLCPNQVYRFSAWVLNICKPGSNLEKPDITLKIQDTKGNDLGIVSSGDIPEDAAWHNYSIDFRSDIASGDIQVVLINNAPGGDGNDLAIDDITFSVCGPASSVNASLDIFGNGVCENSADLRLTAIVDTTSFTDIRYIWQKSTDSGKTWKDLTSETKNSVLNIAARSYNNGDQYRFFVAESTNINSTSCRVASEPQTVKVWGYPHAPGDQKSILCVGSIAESVEAEGENIVWYTDETGGSALTSAPVPDTSELGETVYWITQKTHGCESEKRSKFTVVIEDLPSKPTVNDISYCQDEKAVSLSAGGENLTWYSAPEMGDGTSFAPVPKTDVSGIFSYWVSQKPDSCESERSEIKVTIKPKPFSENLKDTSICDGQTLKLNAYSPDIYSYEWKTSPPVFSPQLEVGETGIYTVILTGNNGCSAELSATVTAGETPQITKISTGEDFIEVEAIGGNPPYFYSLDNEKWQSENRFDGLKAGVYPVYVKSQTSSCTATEDAAVIFVPNVITPDGDGKNDTFRIGNISHFPDAVLNIYDRFGTQVFSSMKNNAQEWDGTAAGRTVSSGTYWYHLSLGNGYEKSGWILVKNR